MLNVIVCGIMGHMGTRLMEVCFEDQNTKVVAGIDAQNGTLNNVPIFSSPSACDVDADVLIDFSNPSLTLHITDYCRSTKTALVMCTTGHSEEDLEQIRLLSLEIPVFRSANMSLGIALLKSLAKQAAVLLKDNFDIEIIERHHNRKLDAPSGTAILLADEMNKATGGQYEYIYDRHTVRQKRDKREIGIHSIRGGTIVGEHDILFSGNDERIVLSHAAASRTVFASGALRAAHFIHESPPGLYDMDSILNSLL